MNIEEATAAIGRRKPFDIVVKGVVVTQEVQIEGMIGAIDLHQGGDNAEGNDRAGGSEDDS